MNRKYQVLNQMNDVLMDNMQFGDAAKYAYSYMKMYGEFTHKDGKFYAGERKKKNLRLKIQVMP